MRNLAILSHQVLNLNDAVDSSLRLEAIANNVDDDTIYAVASGKADTSSADVKIIFLAKRTTDQTFSAFSSFVVPSALPALPGSCVNALGLNHDQLDIISFHYLSDGGQEALNQPALCAITAGGDILLLALHTDPSGPAVPQIVGSIVQGIVAASWSPDDELLVIVTSETVSESDRTESKEGKKLLLMTRDFEVLSEHSLRTDDFGEDAAVDVGWGSKSTQFHGSEGKAAAAAAAASASAGNISKVDPRGPQLPDDDGRPRVSWRGDGAFFAVSSLEAFHQNVSEKQQETTWHRIIRIYARLGALSATSDASIRGISQSLAFRPVGNLIATTQRFGPSDNGKMWAQGRQGRHDVVFIERNGLRHGEFSLREESATQPEGKRIAWTDAQMSNTWSRSHKVRELLWNADGSALAVWLSRTSSSHLPDVDVVQIYTTSNYHWYLKQELVSRVFTSRLNQVRWHAENPFQCSLVFDNRIEHIKFFLETVSSGGRPPHDVACVTVADGSASLLTPFRMQNVPPPMCSSSLLHPPATQHSISDNHSILVPVQSAWTQVPPGAQKETIGIMASLYSNGLVQVWGINWGVLGSSLSIGDNSVAEPKLLKTVQTSSGAEESTSYQIAIAGWSAFALGNFRGTRLTLAVLASDQQGSKLRVADLIQEEGQDEFSVSLHQPVQIGFAAILRLAADPFVPTATAAPNIYLHGESGLIQVVECFTLKPVVQLERFCPEVRILAKKDKQSVRVIGLASNGALYANEQTVAKDATSFTLAGSFLVWTNTSHEARFAPLASLSFSASDTTKTPSDSVDLGRRVERGSRIVTAVNSLMALVLQMPRGNLETIYPRPLVLEVVRRDLDGRRYGAAFRNCRTHRMDVNILYDHNPDEFMANIGLFIRQVQNVDHINLFLSGLRNEDVTTTLYKQTTTAPVAVTETKPDKINRICDAMRVELDKIDSRTYVNSILTTYVRKIPADYEGGLTRLLKLKDDDQQTAEEAVKYIIFLADADKLFDVALGMYDFALTLLIAQHAQRKDPREYLPFLRELRSFSPPEYQRFKIDDHLKRHSKALSWLFKAGAEHHGEGLQYTQKHRLFHQALDIFQEDAVSSTYAASRLRDVYALFGSYLVSRRKFEDAGMMYQLAHQYRNAIDAYKQSQNWREVLRLAVSERLPTNEVVVLAKELIDELEITKKFSDASQISLDYLKDVEQGVTLLCKDNNFSEAGRVLQTQSRPDLISTTFNPLLLEAATWLLDESSEIKEQLDKQMARIAELRAKTKQQPEGFYGEDDPALDNIDVMSDTSTQMTQFTRYTTTASIATQSSLATFSTKSGSRKKEAKLKKKQERNKAGGKKGSVYEEDYLYTSVAKLLNERLGVLQKETSKILPNIAVSASAAVRLKAKEIHNVVHGLENRAHEAVAKLWSYSQEDDDQRFRALVQFEADILSGSLASNPTLASMTLRTCFNRAVPRPKITIAETKWRTVLFDQTSL